MKAAEIAGGVAVSLHLRCPDRPFHPLPRTEDEVTLVHSGDQTLLALKGEVWAVEGTTPAETTVLTDVVVSGLPLIAFVAHATADTLVVETRRFTQEVRVVEPMDLAIDDKVMADMRRSHGVGGTVADVAVWLRDRLVLPPAPVGPATLLRMVVSSDPRGLLDAFRIHGLKVSADVRRIDDKLRIERVVRGGKTGNRRLILIYAPIALADATAAAALHGAVRTALSEAVTGSDSYLTTWLDYHRIEQEIVRRRARVFGTLEYSSCKKRRDGGWSFQLAPVENLPERLASLGDWDRFELEAGAAPPKLAEAEGKAAAEVKPATGARPRVQREQLLSASLVAVNAEKSTLNLAAPDEDEVQPRPPDAGYLFLSTSGDEARLARRERAEEALRTGNCPLPQLGLLMEGRPAPAARRSRVSVDAPKLKAEIREVFGRRGPTPRQLEAIEIALNTPDVCLIQGPPGTGKTKVITAIERCLAVLADEGVEPSHRILVSAAQHDAVENVAQRTEVFGLPAHKVGRRRHGSDTAVDPTEVFVDERVDQLRARTRVPPEAERLTQARGLVLACVRARSLPAELAGRLRELVRLLDTLLPPELRDATLQRAAAMERPVGLGDPEEADLLLKAARAIRVDTGAFTDDGPVNARKALRRLESVLTPEERAFLTRCAAAEAAPAPPWLASGQALRDALIDRLTQAPQAAELRLDDDTQRLLLDVLDTVDRRLAGTRTGAEAAVAAYLGDLESDPEGVRSALAHYTVVLASTLQQAAGNEMRKVRGIITGQTTFESVIVDEAARANPLDLFIPLSMAIRRVVLVGDHRQLPHLLEPDVERQLAEGVDQGTVEQQTLDAVRLSLFERLWVLLRALEQQDGIPRTKTLDTQFRMHPVLGAFVSRSFYEIHEDGPIRSELGEATFAHDLPGYVKARTPCAAAWLDVPAERGREVRGISKYRPVEARTIAREVWRLIDHDPRLTFGVISFYAAQVDEIGRAMLKEGLTAKTADARGWKVAEAYQTTLNAEGRKVERLRVGTVDAFQGKEFDVVFLSVTRSNDLPGETDEQRRRKFGHLMLENRLCVAMSRQQRLLVVVGDRALVEADCAEQVLRPLRSFLALCGGQHGAVR